MSMATYPTMTHAAPTFVPAFQMPPQLLPASHGALHILIATPQVNVVQNSHAVPSCYPSSFQGHDAFSTLMINHPYP